MALIIPPYRVSQLSALLTPFLNRVGDQLSQNFRNILLGAPPDSRYVQLIYTSGLRQLGEGPDAAKITSTRFLAVLHGHAVAADITERDGSTRISSISSGCSIVDAIDAIDSIRRLPEVQKADYELHTFSVPGVQTDAYWLKSPTGNNHRFVPYLTLNKNLQRGTAYSWGDFVKALDEAAKKNIEFYERDMDSAGPYYQPPQKI